MGRGFVSRWNRGPCAVRRYVKANEPEQGVKSAPPLPAIVEGCKYDFSVIAAIVAMKFAFHMPTYREQDFFGQSGWRPSRSTSNDLINYSVDCIDPLFRQMLACILSQPIVLGDATELIVLLNEVLDEAEQKALEARRKQRQTPKAESTPAEPRKSDGSAKSYAWLYSGLDAPREFLPDLEEEDPPPSRPPPDFSERRWSNQIHEASNAEARNDRASKAKPIMHRSRSQALDLFQVIRVPL